jgi:hypothetical protein
MYQATSIFFQQITKERMHIKDNNKNLINKNQETYKNKVTIKHLSNSYQELDSTLIFLQIISQAVRVTY